MNRRKMFQSTEFAIVIPSVYLPIACGDSSNIDKFVLVLQ